MMVQGEKIRVTLPHGARDFSNAIATVSLELPGALTVRNRAQAGATNPSETVAVFAPGSWLTVHLVEVTPQ